MKKRLIFVIFICLLMVGVGLIVSNDIKKQNNANPVAPYESMEYTVVDGNPIEEIMSEYDVEPGDITTVNQGYLIIDKDGITGYIDPEGNTYSLEE